MKRRLAREITVQCLYQMEMNGVGAEAAVDTVMEEIRQDNELEADVEGVIAVDAFTRELVRGVSEKRERLDSRLAAFLTGWQVDRLSRVDRQILRLAAYELEYRTDVPAKVVVNEAIELAKHFGTDESGKFVNGVLGRMIREKQSKNDEPASPAASNAEEGEQA
mgnify:CR=1 FL=1